MKKYFLLFLLIFNINACYRTNENKTIRSYDKDTLSEYFENIVLDDSLFFKIADTIIYDVIIKNPNPDDNWTEQCLMSLHREEFLDLLFQNLYNGNFKAYDIFTDKLLSLKNLKSLEKLSDYKRDKIGKMQFKEIWYFNKQNKSFGKKVLEIAFGYEAYDNNGYVKGYKPLFKIKF